MVQVPTTIMFFQTLYLKINRQSSLERIVIKVIDTELYCNLALYNYQPSKKYYFGHCRLCL